MFERWVVPALSTVLSFGLFLGALASLAFLLFRTAIPCEPEGGLYVFAQLAVPVSYIVSAIWLSRLMFRPKAGSFIIAITVPASMTGLFFLTAHWSLAAQRSCMERRDSQNGRFAPMAHLRLSGAHLADMTPTDIFPV